MIKKSLGLALIAFGLFQPLNATERSKHVEYYLGYLSEHKALQNNYGQHELGEIEIITDPQIIETVEKIQKERWMKRGYSEEEANRYSRIGVIDDDPYWVWIRDPVLFPSGIFGTYNRVVWKSSLEGAATGAIVMPVTKEGKIVLNCIYRHATRSWEIELPRGLREEGETSEEAAIRETQEETGYEVSSLELLGHLAPNPGLTSSTPPVYFAYVSSPGLMTQDDSEAIDSIITLSKEEAKKGLVEGSILIERQGKKISVPFRDPSLTFALLIAETKGLL